jgi:hypothetical protein
MRIVTLLGVMLAFVLGTTGCNRSSDTSRHDTTGGDAREQAEQEREEFKGKTESLEEDVEEFGEDVEREFDEAGERTEDELEDAEEYLEEQTD